MSTSRKELDKGRTLESNYANRGKKWLSLEEFSLFYAWLLASPAGPREALSPRVRGKDTCLMIQLFPTWQQSERYGLSTTANWSQTMLKNPK